MQNINNQHIFPHPENDNENFVFKNGNFENISNRDEKRKKRKRKVTKDSINYKLCIKLIDIKL